MKAWLNQAIAWVDLVRAQWVGNEHTEQEVQELQRELETVLGPLGRSSWFARDNFGSF